MVVSGTTDPGTQINWLVSLSAFLSHGTDIRFPEPARDLMDLIVEGPESDRIWAVYQTTKSDGDPIATDLDIGHSSLEL